MFLTQPATNLHSSERVLTLVGTYGQMHITAIATKCCNKKNTDTLLLYVDRLYTKDDTHYRTKMVKGTS